jgi:hypothetical protein
MFALLLAQMIAVSSVSSGWWYIGDAGAKPQRSVIFASLGTRQVDDNIARIWTWTVNENLTATGRESMKILWENRCITGEQRSVMIVSYSQNGEPMASVNHPSEWSFVVPDSNGSKIFSVACTGKTENMMPVLNSQGTPVEVARKLFEE